MHMPAAKPESWVRVRPEGLFVEPGGFFIDPVRRVERALVTHGHGDHARPGNRRVLATPETLAIMRLRYGDDSGALQPLAYGEPIEIGGVRVTLVPAGHVLGSAQAVLEWQGSRVVVSGDYKRRPDPTCAPFELVRCDVFVTEATAWIGSGSLRVQRSVPAAGGDSTICPLSSSLVASVASLSSPNFTPSSS